MNFFSLSTLSLYCKLFDLPALFKILLITEFSMFLLSIYFHLTGRV